jgi:hypothetical protein
MYVNYNKVTDWTEASVSLMLATNDAWLEKAIVALYLRQVELEKQGAVTIDKNDEGLQQADARLFTRFARKLMSGAHLNAYELAQARRPWHRPRVPIPTICKYRKQILDIIESRAKTMMEAAR